jgi:hypothetical protein
MELAGSAYLYTLATLAMTFVGFCAIVLIFRQSMGTRSSKSHRYASHVYIELGFEAAAFAMLAPLLTVCELPSGTVWRLASAIIVVALIVHTWSILKRFKETWPGPFPRRVWFNTTVTAIVAFGLLANVAAVPFQPNSGPVAVAATWRLVMGIEIFLVTLEIFLASPGRRRRSQ